MAYAIRVVCSQSAAAGFRLIGLSPIEATDAAEGVRLLGDAVSRPEVGVILVEDSIYSALPDSARRALASQPIPMVVPFPGPVWISQAEAPESFIAELLRQAIGYRVKLA